jgi:FkbH-like protein
MKLRMRLRFLASKGYRRLAGRSVQHTSSHQIDGAHFRVPRDLSRTPAELSAVLVLGECVGSWLADGAESIGCMHDFLLINNYSVLPDSPPRPATDYDFQLVQLPLRSVLPEWDYLRLPFDDESAWQALLETSRSRLGQMIDSALRYNIESGLLTFVAGFLVPQQNPMGRLLHRNEPRNLVFLVESLNRDLADLLTTYGNSYFLDIDGIASGFGKRFIQDDLINASTHGAFLSDWDEERDTERIEPPKGITEYFDIRVDGFRDAVWAELLALYRTVRQLDQVKLVIVDLDDTLWRGVIAEQSDLDDDSIEGWPMGVIEALSFLKKRGILLGIISKNDESKVEGLWSAIFRGRLDLSDFVVRKINWQPKIDNLEEILHEVNLLSRNVVFIDDNPVERAAIQAAFPDVRVLGAELYQIRRILMWSPETQVPFVSAESARRTEMVHGQVEREKERKKVPRNEFLRDLKIRVRLFDITAVDDDRFPRCLELVNKTNQFNTSGQRRTSESCGTLFRSAGSFLAFEVSDRYTRYGIVGVIVLKRDSDGTHIEQFVMSCRVFGLDVEMAVLKAVVQREKTGRQVTAFLAKLSNNQPCWDVYQRVGLVEGAGDGLWVVPADFEATVAIACTIEWVSKSVS